MKIKEILSILLIAGSLSVLPSCSSAGSDNKEVIIVKEADIVKKTIGVKGMTCVGCEVTLEKNISKITGVVNVKASVSNDEAVIEYDSTKTDLATIRKTIEESGYKALRVSE